MAFSFRLRFVAAALGVIPTLLVAQDRLPRMPGYAQFMRAQATLPDLNRQLNATRLTNVKWIADGSGIEYTLGGLGTPAKTYQYIFAPSETSSLRSGLV